MRVLLARLTDCSCHNKGSVMSLFSNIDHLHVCPGIEAVSVLSPQNPRIFRGPNSWCPILDTALNLFSMTSESSIRMVVGSFTVLIQRENQETVAVVLPTGHAIAKSLRRMIRRMARKDRASMSAQEIAEKHLQKQEMKANPTPAPSVEPIQRMAVATATVVEQGMSGPGQAIPPAAPFQRKMMPNQDSNSSSQVGNGSGTSTLVDPNSVPAETNMLF